MKCPECVASDQKSTVRVGMSYSTCMGTQTYYDEDGKYHFHDPNSTSTNYSCSNGHSWSEVAKAKCPSCNS